MTDRLTPLQVGQAAPEATVLDEQGVSHALRDLWQDAPAGAAIVFLRPFG